MLFRVREVTGVEVPLRIVFEDPSIAAIATYVEAVQFANQSAANDAESDDREEISL